MLVNLEHTFLRRQLVRENILSKFAPLNLRPGYSLGEWAGILGNQPITHVTTIANTISLDRMDMTYLDIAARLY